MQRLHRVVYTSIESNYKKKSIINIKIIILSYAMIYD